MLKSRDVVMFIAGAFFLHTVSHIIFPYIVTLPIDFNLAVLTPDFQIAWTPMLNMVVVIVSAIITIALVWWGSRLK